jgi:hypothetical protein
MRSAWAKFRELAPVLTSSCIPESKREGVQNLCTEGDGLRQ